jgi:hypothetical protein
MLVLKFKTLWCLSDWDGIWFALPAIRHAIHLYGILPPIEVKILCIFDFQCSFLQFYMIGYPEVLAQIHSGIRKAGQTDESEKR